VPGIMQTGNMIGCQEDYLKSFYYAFFSRKQIKNFITCIESFRYIEYE